MTVMVNSWLFCGSHPTTSTCTSLTPEISMNAQRNLRKKTTCLPLSGMNKTLLCYQFPQDGQKWPLAIKWNPQASGFWEQRACIWWQPQHQCQRHLFPVSSVHGELSNASVLTHITPQIAQFGPQGLWNLRCFITMEYLSGAWLVGRNFTSFQHQNS